jgi:hypothetical protein
VDLRLDMDVIVAVSAAPTPRPARLRPGPGGHRRLALRPGPPDDVCRRFRPECARALHNTDMQYLA